MLEGKITFTSLCISYEMPSRWFEQYTRQSGPPPIAEVERLRLDVHAALFAPLYAKFEEKVNLWLKAAYTFF